MFRRAAEEGGSWRPQLGEELDNAGSKTQESRRDLCGAGQGRLREAWANVYKNYEGRSWPEAWCSGSRLRRSSRVDFLDKALRGVERVLEWLIAVW